jgi:Xaa-Pro aminopeptidase
LFVDPRKVAAETAAHLGNAVTLSRMEDFAPALDKLGAEKASVLADPMTAASFVFQRLEGAGAKVKSGSDPCVLPKACKNSVELGGMRAAHVRDGGALTRFLAWLSTTGAANGLDEMAAADELYRIRSGGKHFQRLSFPTIAGSGPNGAIVHYRAGPETNRTMRKGELFLLDSGAQYLDGTTDVTRTIAIGEPDAEQRDRFTRVLKGHIALATCRFPQGTTGSQLDTLARNALWQAGLDFDHGTGHGVGSYLNVHEGPQRISKVPSRQPLLAGMIVSNEPGYYKAGAYGIRIENLVAVREAKDLGGGERKFLEFETITLAPIDRNLVDAALLDDPEKAWLDAYHARVRETLTPLLNADEAEWLRAATAPVGT